MDFKRADTTTSSTIKKTKVKYNLTLLQRLELIPLWFFWFFYPGDKKNRQSWHLIKKGMEKHEHNFVIPVPMGRFTYYQCDHEGCMLSEDPSLIKKKNEN